MAADGDGEAIRVEVVFAAPDRQQLIAMDVAAGSSVVDVIAASGLAAEFPEYRFAELEVGIWGRTVSAHRVVVAGDRVEIYRPLAIDPREARRDLASRGRSIGRAEDDG